MLERQVEQFEVELAQSQPIGDRRVDIERLGRNAPALDRVDRVQCAHVVQAVGQLDQDDPDIAGHRQQHLAKTLGLLLFLALELDAVQLGQAIDQIGHLRAEAFDECLFGGTGVFHHIVQQRRHQ